MHVGQRAALFDFTAGLVMMTLVYFAHRGEVPAGYHLLRGAMISTRTGNSVCTRIAGVVEGRSSKR